MNWADILLITILYANACIWQANYQAKQFERQLQISHFWHAVFYAVFCMLIFMLYWHTNGIRDGVVAGIYGGFVRLAFFDFILNKFRGKPLLYNGEVDDKLTKAESIIDWLENHALNYKTGKRRLLILKTCYLIIWAAYVIIILIYAIDRKF